LNNTRGKSGDEMNQEGLPTFIGMMLAALILGVMIIVGMVLHAILGA